MKRKIKLKFNASDARNWLESRADLGGVLMGLIDGTFAPANVAKEINKYKYEKKNKKNKI